MVIETSSTKKCFGGAVSFHSHASEATDTKMNFSVYVPPAAEDGRVPVLYYFISTFMEDHIRHHAERLDG